MIDLDFSPDAIARVTYILSRPMTALEFADAYWPERVKRKPGVRSRGGHALLNALARKGLVRRRKSDKPDIPDTFVLAYAQQTDLTPTHPEEHADCYWVLLWRGENDWGWLYEGEDWKTQHPGKRLRITKYAEAMMSLWAFRMEKPELGRSLRVVRVTRMLAMTKNEILLEEVFVPASSLRNKTSKLLASLGNKRVSILIAKDES